MATVVLLLGGECTGKTALANAIATWGNAQDPTRMVRIVPEVLRGFGDRHGRTPLQHEQEMIWREQTRLLHLAIDGSHSDQVVVCDPAPLMTAVYSVQYFDDESLLPQALAAIDPDAVVAWCAPDIPWEADGVHRDGPQERDRTHRLLTERFVPALAARNVISVSGDLDDRVAQLAAHLA